MMSPPWTMRLPTAKAGGEYLAPRPLMASDSLHHQFNADAHEGDAAPPPLRMRRSSPLPVVQAGRFARPPGDPVWICPDARLLHYAIGSDGGHVNVFAVAAFADWHPAVRQMVAAGDVERRWGLFVAPPSRHALLPRTLWLNP
ncbi:hypothetical protein [Sphingomonas parapaucimobilis]|uniref:hypothetical protein n=1 Tax=Sphingomonas parapaucimobilis TaxID=28213 RepID=UPI0035C827A7